MLMRRRAAVLLAAIPLLLLTGCGDDEKPTRSKDIEPGPTCRTEGTVEAQPAASLEAAVAPYRDAGDNLRIAERFGDTAEIQLRAGDTDRVSASVSLVKTGRGWVVTSVVRC